MAFAVSPKRNPRFPTDLNGIQNFLPRYSYQLQVPSNNSSFSLDNSARFSSNRVMSYETFRSSLLNGIRIEPATPTITNRLISLSDDGAATLIQKTYRRWKVLKPYKESYDTRRMFRENVIKETKNGCDHLLETLSLNSEINEYFYKQAKSQINEYALVLYEEQCKPREKAIFTLFCKVADKDSKGSLAVEETVVLMRDLLRLSISEGMCLTLFTNAASQSRSDLLPYSFAYSWYIQHKCKYKFNSVTMFSFFPLTKNPILTKFIYEKSLIIHIKMSLIFFNKRNKPLFQCSKCKVILKYPMQYCHHIVRCNRDKS